MTYSIHTDIPATGLRRDDIVIGFTTRAGDYQPLPGTRGYFHIGEIETKGATVVVARHTEHLGAALYFGRRHASARILTRSRHAEPRVALTRLETPARPGARSPQPAVR